MPIALKRRPGERVYLLKEGQPPIIVDVVDISGQQDTGSTRISFQAEFYKIIRGELIPGQVRSRLNQGEIPTRGMLEEIDSHYQEEQRARGQRT